MRDQEGREVHTARLRDPEGYPVDVLHAGPRAGCQLCCPLVDHAIEWPNWVAGRRPATPDDIQGSRAVAPEPPGHVVVPGRAGERLYLDAQGQLHRLTDTPGSGPVQLGRRPQRDPEVAFEGVSIRVTGRPAPGRADIAWAVLRTSVRDLLDHLRNIWEIDGRIADQGPGELAGGDDSRPPSLISVSPATVFHYGGLRVSVDGQPDGSRSPTEIWVHLRTGLDRWLRHQLDTWQRAYDAARLDPRPGSATGSGPGRSEPIGHPQLAAARRGSAIASIDAANLRAGFLPVLCPTGFHRFGGFWYRDSPIARRRRRR